ncbi:MAG TPA: cupin domain-containing protein [Edaphobacter sp.]|nr:cupin domain-containing protein [Edaphobacter sp.]
MTDVQPLIHKAPAIKLNPQSKRCYFDVAIGSVCLSGEDTGGAYCLLELSMAPGIGVPRHIHTREDESFYILSGELQVMIRNEVLHLKPGDSLMAPRNIPHQLLNTGSSENHYQILLSPSNFEKFLMGTAVPAPDKATPPTERQLQMSHLQLPLGMSLNSQLIMELFSVEPGLD